MVLDEPGARIFTVKWIIFELVSSQRFTVKSPRELMDGRMPEPNLETVGLRSSAQIDLETA
ncbi:hypothetical protein KNHN1_55250 (plasmid) [Pseudomonas guariconensis]